MERTLRFSRQASKDIQNISDYTLREFGELQNQDYVLGLFAALDKRVFDPGFMSSNEPELATALGFGEDQVKSFKYMRHRCYFYFDTQQLHVLSLLHDSQDKARSFEKIKANL
jgi:plasmid stabilization system protein ParE